MTAEELLMSEESETFEYSNVITIDRESRAINIPLGQEIFGVEGEKSVSIKHFSCPKIVGDNIDIDLSEYNLYANYTISDEKGNQKSEDPLQDVCKNIVVDGDNITFDWKISEWVTREDGYIAFSIVAKKSVDGVLETRWYTTPAVGKVLKTVKEGRYIEQQYPDVIDNLMNRVSDLERILANGGGSGGNIVVDDKLSEESTNPVQNKVVTKELGRLSEEIADLTGGTYSSIEPKEDDIPKVFFSEAIPQTKTDTVTEFRYISKTKDVSGYAEFKAQGNSSMSYPKKNVTVKMYADEALEEKLKVDFKGWGEQRKHVYKANWIDLSHARNVVSARLWADIVKSRAEYLSLPELLRTSPNQGAVDGFPIKVYSQGIYQGRYTLNIPKDAWMANMDDSLDTHCILCGENYASGCFRASAKIDESDWTDEIHDTVPTSIKTRWNEVITFVMNSTDEEFKANLENYFFVDSLIDYFIFGMVSCGLDAFGKNQLYFTYDGIKWIASMYDMDSTWGLYWNGSKFVSASYSREQFEDFVSTSSSGDGNLLYIRLASLFYAEIQARYAELKQGALSVPNIINHFERFTDIAPLDLVKEDYASTTASGKFTGIPSQSTNNIQQIRKYIVDRYAYCDEYFASLGENGGEVEPDNPVDPDIPDEPIEKIWSDTKTNRIDNTTGIAYTTGGDAYVSEYIEVAEDVSSVTLQNANGGKFVWKELYAYDSNKAYLGKVASNNGGDGGKTTASTITKVIFPDMAYVRATATGDTEPNSKLEFVFEKSSVNPSPEGVLYSLSEPTTFDGVDDYIDTGVKLFEESKDFSILIDYTPSATNSNEKVVFHCIKEVSPWNGIAINIQYPNGYRVCSGSNSKYFNEGTNSSKRIKMAIRRSGNASKIKTNTGFDDTLPTTTALHDNSTLLGCYQTTDGTKGRFWTGTIHDCKIYEGVLSDDEITSFLTQTNEPDDENNIDYTLDGLANTTWTSGKTYNKTTGVLQTSNGEYCTEKVVLQNSLYEVINETGGTYPAVFLWDENDNYQVGIETFNGGLIESLDKFIVCGSPYTKLASKVYSTDSIDYSKFKVMPIDNSANPQEYKKINLTDYTFIKSGYSYEITLNSNELPSGFTASGQTIDYSGITSIISNCGSIIIAPTKSVNAANNPSKYAGKPLLWIRAYNSNILVQTYGFASADEVNAYMANNNVCLEFNVHLKPSE